MACSNIQPICNNIVISQSVTFAAGEAPTTTPGTLAINLPAGTYANGHKYCIVIGQPIPFETTITANVVFTIGDDETTYPLINCNGTNVQASAISTRTRYATRVATNIASGVFQLLGNINCCNCKRNNSNAAASLPIPAAAE